MNKQDPKQGGYTLIELMAALTIFGFLSAMFFKFVLYSSYGLTHVENSTDLIRLAQRMRQNVAQTVGSSQVLFAETTTSGTVMFAYQTLINTSRAAGSNTPVPVSMSSQPHITSTASVDSTLGASFGNELMMACVITPLKLSVTVTASPLFVPIVDLDRYQFVYLYLGTQPNIPLANFGSPAPAYGAMGLVEWRSKPYVSYGELSNLGNKLAATAALLVTTGYTYAWDSSATDPSLAFHAITATSPYVASTGTSIGTNLGEQSWAWVGDFNFTQKYAVDPLKPNKRVSTSDRLGESNLYISRYSMAYNCTNTSSTGAYKVNSLYGDYGINLVVPLMSSFNNSNGFPGGFEVAISGLPGSRQVYTRGVIMASSGTEQTTKAYRATAFESLNYVVNPY